MSQYGKEFHRWLNGEFRTDGFRSDWHKDQLRRRAEEMGQRKFVTAPQIKRRQERRSKPVGPARKCECCEEKIRRCNKTGRCGKHPMEKRLPMRTDYRCGCCDKSIRKTAFGICKGCFYRYRRVIEQDRVRVCAEPRCLYSLNKNNTHAKCRKHSRYYLKQAA